MTKVLNSLLKCICHLLWVMSFILLLCFMILILQTLIDPGVTIAFNIEGVNGFIDFWSDYGVLVKAFIAFLTLAVASTQLKRYIDLETITTLAKLRELLTSDVNMEIHHRIITKQSIIGRTEDINIRPVDIYNYLGTLELGAIMFRKGAITIEEFANQFGYRIEEVMHNENIYEQYVCKELKYYNDLIYIWNKLQEYNNKQSRTNRW